MPLTNDEREAFRAEIRRKTTSSLTRLPDVDLDSFIDAPVNYVNGVYDTNAIIADAWEFLSRGDLYTSQSVGNLSVGMPLAPRRAAYYRSLSFSGGGSTLVSGTVRNEKKWTVPAP